VDPKLFATDPDQISNSCGSGSDFEKVPVPSLNIYSSSQTMILKTFNSSLIHTYQRKPSFGNGQNYEFFLLMFT
jgi:hypothetical protein